MPLFHSDSGLPTRPTVATTIPIIMQTYVVGHIVRPQCHLLPSYNPPKTIFHPRVAEGSRFGRRGEGKLKSMPTVAIATSITMQTDVDGNGVRPERHA